MDENQNPSIPNVTPVPPPVAAPEVPTPAPAPAAPVVAAPAPAPLTTKQPMSMGTVLWLIVIVALIIVGALYFWGQKVANEAPTDTTPTATVNIEGSTAPEPI